MANDDAHRVTGLLGRLREGHPEAADELARLVHPDLLRIAERRMRGWPGQTLEPAALVSECWLRLSRQRQAFRDRAHFLAIASRIMLRVLLDAERRRRLPGGRARRVTLNFDIPAASGETGIEAGLLHEALSRLAAASSRKAEVARLRGLAGLSITETARTLGVSAATVERDWAFARAWLSCEVERLRDGPGPGGQWH